MHEDENSSEQEMQEKYEKPVINDMLPQNVEMTSKTPDGSKVIKISDLMDKSLNKDPKTHRTWAKSMITEQQVPTPKNGRAISSSS
jgi:hypothetical protein